MTADQMLQRYVRRDGDKEESDNIEDVGGSFGLLRGIRDRCLAVEFRKLDDTVLAVPYPMIEQFLFSPANGITIRAVGREIGIKGRHLNDSSAKSISLFSALTRGKVSWIAEHSRLAKPGPNAGPIIELLIW